MFSLAIVQRTLDKYGLHLDAKQVLRKISGKRPGKHCVGKSGKGSYISAEKKCADHRNSAGKLTESGKISARELASKVRKRKGMSDRDVQKDDPLKVVKKTRGEVLQASLEKKQKRLSDKFDQHFGDVRSANGQPLNDKRNGRSTMNRWEKQNSGIRNQIEEIKKTERAIENENWKERRVQEANKDMPTSISKMVESGDLIQWRKYPNRFFVPGVDKARIVWDPKKEQIAHSHTGAVTDKEQWKKFANTYNQLRADLKAESRPPAKD